jgi:hypothetical protein
VIVLDPPPPVEAAGSSLLYSTQFYDVAKLRLRRGGILQQWLPDAEDRIVQAVTKSLVQAFPHVDVYRAAGGYHFLASMEPIPALTPAEFAERLPEAARRDLLEWNPDDTVASFTAAVLAERTTLATVLPDAAAATAITDDQPFNEYYVLRRRGLLK